MSIPDSKLRAAKPQDKRYRIPVGDNLFLEIMTTGHKVWRMRYRRPDTKKPAILTIGAYRDLGSENIVISMVDARQAAQDAKKLLRQGIDPQEHRKRLQEEAEEQARLKALEIRNSFENVARDWHQHRFEVLKKWKPEHAEKIMRMLSNKVFPEVGNIPIKEVTAAQLLDMIQLVIDSGAQETAKKINQHINGIYRYAAVRKIVAHNEAENLRDELPVIERVNNPYLIADEVPDFIRAIEQGDAGEIVKIGIMFTMRTLSRTAETRFAKWDEFDMEGRVWNVPVERMKMNRPHIVPLSNQVVELLEKLRAFTGQYDYLFVTRGWNKPMSANAMIYALYRFGYKHKLTIHGLRATGSTILNDAGFRGDVVEMALAHAEGNRVRGAYNHALYLEERREMLQWYSDYLDGLRQGAQVIPIHQKRA